MGPIKVPQETSEPPHKRGVGLGVTGECELWAAGGGGASNDTILGSCPHA